MAQPHGPVAAPAKWRTRWARPVGRFLDYVLYDVKAHHKDRVPRQGGVILAANHISLLDGPLLVGVSPRFINMLTKQEMFTTGVAWLLRLSGQIPVNRKGDKAALEKCYQVLRRGDAVGIFPEGTRGHGPLSVIHAGVVRMAWATGSPVVPVAILGSRLPGEPRGKVGGLRRRVHFMFGEPFTLEAPAEQTEEALAAAKETVRLRLLENLREARDRLGVPLPVPLEG